MGTQDSNTQTTTGANQGTGMTPTQAQAQRNSGAGHTPDGQPIGAPGTGTGNDQAAPR
jgi:hypothetical protein